MRLNGLVKSPSVPLRAALRFNFVVAAPKGPYSSVLARLASGAFYETIGPYTFCRFIEPGKIFFGLVLTLKLTFFLWGNP